MFNERTVVVDCAFGRTALGVFTQAGGRLQLRDYASVAHGEDATNEAAWLGETRAALQKMRAHATGVPVVLVLPASLALTKYARLPAVDAVKRGKILRFEAAQGIPLPLGEVVWDAVAADTAGAATEAVICAAKSQPIEALCDAAEAAGMRIRHLVPATLTLGTAAEAAGVLAAEPQALLSASAHAVVVTLCHAGAARARSSAPGQLAGATATELAARLGAELTRTVAHFQKTGGAESPREIHVTGALFSAPAVAAELARRLNLPVRPFDALRGVEVAREAAAAGVTRDAQELSELIGGAALILAGKPVPNLMPPRLRATEEQRRRQWWWAAIAALLMLAPLPAYLHHRGIRIATEAKTAAIEAEIAPLREREARIRRLIDELAAARATERRWRELHERRDGWVGLMADLQERLGRIEDAWFDSMKITGASTPGETGWRITVTGRLLDKTNPRAQAGRDASVRVRALLTDINSSPFVSVAGEKFNDAQAGILQFNFTLVPKTARPL